MGTPRARLRLALIQIRSQEIPLRQEQNCFIERCGAERHQFQFFNLTREPEIRWRELEHAHAVFIGGAGAYSVTREHPFSAPLGAIVERLIGEDRPLFGSCWGHQFLAQMHGGTVVEDKLRSEVGTFPITLTEAGVVDPLFGDFSERFPVQLGHNDRVSSLGPDWVELARSELVPNQAIRLRGKPVYATQFHPEMNEERLRERLFFYLDDYVADEDEHRRILRRLRPSLEADRLIRTFLDLYA
ncbi:MAG: type 1 glutamine amidotransferase [Thermoanaerobaculales bacterium]